ncbi:hypothetical protein EON80_05560, partial [bacterium]
MNIPFGLRFGVLALGANVLTGVAQAAPAVKKPAAKAKPKAVPKLGIKKTPQMTGSVGRFGELYGLKSGFTYEILSARYSYDAFDDYSGLYPDPSQKLLVLKVAIKNGTPADNWFSGDQHSFQLQDANNQTYSGNSYRLAAKGSAETSLTLKPGQGAGLEPGNALEVAIPVADGANITKIVLQNGRKGSKDDVMRFFVAGTQGGDLKN